MVCFRWRTSHDTLLPAFAACVLAISSTYAQDRQATTDQPRMFESVVSSLEQGDFPPQHALLIQQHGELQLERYWSGPDLVYGRPADRDFGPDDLHGTRSCTKSVVGLLVGIAVHEGLLPVLETPAHTLFPDLGLENQKGFSAKHREVTLEHLLTMTDGFDWQQHESDDHPNNEAELEQSDDVAAYVWSQPMKRAPGEAFNYNSAATALLARAVRRGSGRDIEAFAEEKLFGPLQIEHWEWLHDLDNEPAAHFGLRLTPRDMLKVGQLVLQDGEWNGKQVVPAAWIKEMSDHANGTRKYRYQWWLEDFSTTEQPARVVAAFGRGGQSIFVLPQQDAVVVLTAGHYDDNRAAGARKNLVRQVILPELLAR
ncbi:MAG: serine hydrolase [Planctomycetota bacterium]